MHGFNYSIPHFITCVRGTRIVVTSNLIFEELQVSKVEFADYLGCIIFRLCPKTNFRLTSVRYLHLGVTVKTPLARALQKVQGSLTW